VPKTHGGRESGNSGGILLCQNWLASRPVGQNGPAVQQRALTLHGVEQPPRSTRHVSFPNSAGSTHEYRRWRKILNTNLWTSFLCARWRQAGHDGMRYTQSENAGRLAARLSRGAGGASWQLRCPAIKTLDGGGDCLASAVVGTELCPIDVPAKIGLRVPEEGGAGFATSAGGAWTVVAGGVHPADRVETARSKCGPGPQASQLPSVKTSAVDTFSTDLGFTRDRRNNLAQVGQGDWVATASPPGFQVRGSFRGTPWCSVTARLRGVPTSIGWRGL